MNAFASNLSLLTSFHKSLEEQTREPTLADFIQGRSKLLNQIEAIFCGGNNGPVKLSTPLVNLKRNIANIERNERRNPRPDHSRLVLCRDVLAAFSEFERRT